MFFFHLFQLNLQLRNEVTEHSEKDCLQAGIFGDMLDFLSSLNSLSDLKLWSERTYPMVLDWGVGWWGEGGIIPFNPFYFYNAQDQTLC